jgi:hypothetical protein
MRRLVRRRVLVPFVVLGRAAVVADASDHQVLHTIRALPDGSAEPVLFHGDGHDLPMAGSDVVASGRVGDDFLPGRDHATVNLGSGSCAVGPLDQDRPVPVGHPGEVLQEPGVGLDHLGLWPGSIRRDLAVLVIPDALPDHDVAELDVLRVRRGRDPDKKRSVGLPVT